MFLESDSLYALIQSYGWYAGVFCLTLIILGKFIFSNYRRWTSRVRHHDSNRVDEDEDTIPQSHPFFNDEYRILKVEIPNLDLMLDDKPVRERLFKDLLNISFNVVYDIANGIVENVDLTVWSSEEWMNNVSHSVNSILKTIEDKAKEAEMPDIVIKKFLKWQLESVEELQENVLMLGNSRLYSSNIAKTNTLLLILNLLLECMLGDIPLVVGDINGELTGVEYNGRVLE